jgi:glucosamine kinase
MMHKADYYLGVDGGGTQCRARLCDALGVVLGEGVGGPANIRLGLDRVWDNMLIAIDQALSQAGLNRAIFSQTSLGLGLAGITTHADCVQTIASGPTFLYAQAATDAHCACLGAFSGRDGAIMITGTGSAGYAWVKGVGYAVGGWGFEVSDDGSAAGLGREALKAALHGYDGVGPHTRFTRAVMERFGGLPSGIVHWVTKAGPADYGSLAPMVMEFASQGDEVAVDLVERAARDLGRHLARLHALGADKICLVGGMSAPLTPWLAPWTHTVLQQPEFDAVEGALLLARGAAGGMPNGVDAQGSAA